MVRPALTPFLPLLAALPCSDWYGNNAGGWWQLALRALMRLHTRAQPCRRCSAAAARQCMLHALVSPMPCNAPRPALPVSRRQTTAATVRGRASVARPGLPAGWGGARSLALGPGRWRATLCTAHHSVPPAPAGFTPITGTDFAWSGDQKVLPTSGAVWVSRPQRQHCGCRAGCVAPPPLQSACSSPMLPASLFLFSAVQDIDVLMHEIG